MTQAENLAYAELLASDSSFKPLATDADKHRRGLLRMAFPLLTLWKADT